MDVPLRPRQLAALLLLAAAACARAQQPPAHFDLATRRFDIDVDGAPNAYGPPGKPALDSLRNARLQGRPNGPIVGYLTDDDHPTLPIKQGPHDPFPGYYISQTSYTDPARTRAADPLRYVDATRINYVVRGTAARRRGVRMGDFVAVHSARTGRTAFGIVADEGNPSGDEGSLHLLQDLGYHYPAATAAREEGVDRPGEITVRYFPATNPQHQFFRDQAILNAAANALHLDNNFPQPPPRPTHPSKR